MVILGVYINLSNSIANLLLMLAGRNLVIKASVNSSKVIGSDLVSLTYNRLSYH